MEELIVPVTPGRDWDLGVSGMDSRDRRRRRSAQVQALFEKAKQQVWAMQAEELPLVRERSAPYVVERATADGFLYLTERGDWTADPGAARCYPKVRPADREAKAQAEKSAGGALEGLLEGYRDYAVASLADAVTMVNAMREGP